MSRRQNGLPQRLHESFSTRWTGVAVAWSFAPRTVLDVGDPSYWDALLPVFVEVMADRVACVAFPAEAAAEMHDEESPTLDDPGDDALQLPLDEDMRKAIDREKDLLDAVPLPGTLVNEAERQRAWTALPLRVRTAVRRMHRQFGHPSPTVLVQVLRAARALSEYIQACRHFRCDACKAQASIYQGSASERLRLRSKPRYRCPADEPYLC